MKTFRAFLGLILFSSLSFPVLLPAQQGGAQKGDMFTEALKLFEQGNYVEAKQLFDMILQRDPRHQARAYAFRCQQAIAKGAGDSKMERDLGSLTTSVDFQDVPLSDALEYIRVRSNELSGGKISPNIIFNGAKDQLAGKTITLKLNATPMSVVLKYAAQMARCAVKYDAYAITVTPLENVGSPAAATGEKKTDAP